MIDSEELLKLLEENLEVVLDKNEYASDYIELVVRIQFNGVTISSDSIRIV